MSGDPMSGERRRSQTGATGLGRRRLMSSCIVVSGCYPKLFGVYAFKGNAHAGARLPRGDQEGHTDTSGTAIASSNHSLASSRSSPFHPGEDVGRKLLFFLFRLEVDVPHRSQEQTCSLGLRLLLSSSPSAELRWNAL